MNEVPRIPTRRKVLRTEGRNADRTEADGGSGIVQDGSMDGGVR